MSEIRSDPREGSEAYLGSCQTCMTELLSESIISVSCNLKHVFLGEEKMKGNRTEVKVVYLISQGENKNQIAAFSLQLQP